MRLNWFSKAPKFSKILLLNLHFNYQTLTARFDLKPFNSRISQLMKDGLVEDARQLFDETSHKNTVTYNAMIGGYFRNGFFDNAVALYDELPDRDIFSHNVMISGLMRYGDVQGAEEIFECMGYKDIVSWNSMISGYVDNGLINDATLVFDQVPMKDSVSWNLLIAGLVKVKELGKAEELFRVMQIRDIASWTIMIKGRLEAGLLVEARELFDDIPEKDVQAWNTMIVGYLENGSVEIAEGLFHKMPEKDCSSWIAMIDGFLSSRRISDAIRLFSEIPQKCQKTWNSILLAIVRSNMVKEAHAVLEKSPLKSVVSWTNIMKGYFDGGEVENAMKIFDLISARDTTVWNVAIYGLSENDSSEDGTKLFIKMKEDSLPKDEATYTSFLTICSNLSASNLGKEIHAEVIKTGINCFVSTGNALITMYFRCGSIDSALLEFNSMSSHDTISWNSVICGLALNGRAEKAIEVFEKMRLSTTKPNGITFVGVLSACSHAGLVENGKRYFNVMQNVYFLKPANEHYTCVVDLLGRFGLLDEAMDILKQMVSEELEVSASVWGALLGACRMHKNITTAEIVGEKILELEPSNSGVYMILGEMYLANGRKVEAEKIWTRMRKIGVKKQPGCSWTESSRDGIVFLSGDKSHPEFEKVSFMLHLIYLEIRIRILVPSCTSSSCALAFLEEQH